MTKYKEDPRLTCDGGWEASVPGYTYWRGESFEHLGHSGIGNWIEKYPTWIEDTVKIMEHGEKLGIRPAHCYYHWDWFKDINHPSEMKYFEYFAHFRDYFYMLPEDPVTIGFPDITDTTWPRESIWIDEFDIHWWNRYDQVWKVDHSVAKDGDVVYHQMIKLGWTHGSKFGTKEAQNIIGKSYFEIAACFGWFNLPDEKPPFAK